MKIKFIILVLLAYFEESIVKSLHNELDSTRALIWGPGLQPDKVTLKARYIFVQLLDINGKNITRSPGSGVLSVKVQGQTIDGQSCHIWKQIIDCKDGSFIIRYKLYNTCIHMKILIQITGAITPLLEKEIKGYIYEEECNCPNASIDIWLDSYQCHQNNTQMIKDLSYFPIVDFDEIREDIIREYHKPHSISICHYIIKTNQIYRNCYGQHVGFKMFMDDILLSLTRKVVLPDNEFFINLGDWPLNKKSMQPLPIFSWCGSSDTNDIILPTYEITQSSLEAMGRVMVDMLSIQGNNDASWEEKIEKVFWRGRDSRRERLDLIDIARSNPDLFNTSITNFFFYKNEIEKYGPKQPLVSFFKFFDYKYQLNIDGTVAAYRFPYLLSGNSLVFKQESPYYEFFYDDLIPGKHYIQIKRDLSDLIEKIKWARKHDKEAYNIAKLARQFVRDNLLPDHILCYHVRLFHEWSKRLKNKVKVLANMELVPQPKHSCTCHNYEIPKDEL